MTYDGNIVFNVSQPLEDDPERHRWRAYWMTGQLYLEAHRVIKTTPTGVWIAPTSDHPSRWISNTSSSGWAKKTREEAVESAVIRLNRWAVYHQKTTDRIRENAEALRLALPQYTEQAEKVIKILDSVNPYGRNRFEFFEEIV